MKYKSCWFCILFVFVLFRGRNYANSATTSASYYTGTDPISVTAGVDTNIELIGTTRAGDLVSFSKDCTAERPRLPPPLGENSVVKVHFEHPGEYFLCVLSAGETHSSQQNGISVVALAPTPNSTIIAVSPRTLSAGAQVTVRFVKSSASSIKYGFVRAGVACTISHLIHDSPSAYYEAFSKDFLFSETGRYELCVGLQGGSDSRKQTNNIALDVIPKTSQFVVNSISPRYIPVSQYPQSQVYVYGALDVPYYARFQPSCGNENLVTSWNGKHLIQYGDAIAINMTLLPESQILKLCLQHMNGTDSIMQSGIVLRITPTPISPQILFDSWLAEDKDASAIVTFAVPISIEDVVARVKLTFANVFDITAITYARGKMSSDSISFDSTLPEASVQVTYVFKYSKILFVGDKVEIALPSFSGIPTIFQSSCSSTQFGIGHKVLVASNNLLIITLTVGYAPLLSNTDCTVKIDGLKNPNILFETDSGLLQHRVISVSGGMPFLPVTSADGISGGHITDDKIEFTGDPSIGQPTKIKYQFKYDEDITLDSNIVLKMPGWKKQTGASLSAFSDSCGTATNSVLLQLPTDKTVAILL